MNAEDFVFVSEMLKKRSGLVLSEDKTYLLESRLAPIVRRESYGSLDDLIHAMRKPGAEKLVTTVVEAMTTNESYFFRDKTPFELFTDTVVPHMKENRPSGHKMRVWCAAASSGQEPYSLCMLWKENAAKWQGLNLSILGTDISLDILDKAKKGEYSQFEVQRGLPVTLLVKYFKQEGDRWVLNQDIRNMVQLRKFNLLESMSALGKWDVVYCRNVLIYFDPPTKADILERIARQMEPDGFLFLGSTESTFGITDAFEPVDGKRGIYRKSTKKTVALKPGSAMPARKVATAS